MQSLGQNDSYCRRSVQVGKVCLSITSLDICPKNLSVCRESYDNDKCYSVIDLSVSVCLETFGRFFGHTREIGASGNGYSSRSKLNDSNAIRPRCSVLKTS